MLVENGDLNWIVPNKIVAFSGPGARRSEVCGYRTLVPEDYVPYFKQANITIVIRLNKRLYDRRRFTEHGLVHHDLYFPDGSCPPERIVQRFLEILEESPGAVAVHCKAGLGRTGVLIGCYLMKHFRFTANEAIGYLRIIRPGSVIGPQQHFLRDMQSRMWKLGDAFRRHRSEMNRNSRVYASPLPAQDRHPMGPDPSSSLASPLAALSLSREQDSKTTMDSRGHHSISSDAKIGSSSQLVDFSNLTSAGVEDSAPSAVKNNSVKEIEGSYEYRRSYSQDGMQPRPNIYQRSARPVTSRGSLNISSSVNAWEPNHRQSSGVEPSSMGYHYGLRSRSSSMQPTNAEIRSAAKSKDDMKAQPGAGVCTQRTLNAAGQPRKVVVPIAHGGIKDTSPRRRRSSSPVRFTENPGQ